MSNCASDKCEKVGAVECGEEITGVNPNKSDKTGVNLQKSINWSKPVKIDKTGVNLQKSIKPNTTKQTSQSNEPSRYKENESYQLEYNDKTVERLILREEYDKLYNDNCMNKENVPSFEDFLELRKEYNNVFNKDTKSKDNNPTFDEWLNHIRTDAEIISDSNYDDKENHINEEDKAVINKGEQIRKKGKRKCRNFTTRSQKRKLKRENNKEIKQHVRANALKLKDNLNNTGEDMIICEEEDHNQYDPFDFTKYLNFDRLHTLIANDEEWINDDLLYAFLNVLRIQSDREIIVLHPLYEYVYTRPETNSFNDRLYQGDIDNFKIGLIPVFLRNQTHWTLGIYIRDKNEIKYCDSFGADINDMMYERGYLQSAVKDLTKNECNNSNIQIVNVFCEDIHTYENDKYSTLNKQIDSCNCGIHVCVISEQFILNNEITLINAQEFNIKNERARILAILKSLDECNFEYVSREEFESQNKSTKATHIVTEESLKNLAKPRKRKSQLSFRANADLTKKAKKKDKNKRYWNNHYTAKRLPAELNEHDEIEIFALSDMNVKCNHCNALHFQEEKPSKSFTGKFNDCCNLGKFNPNDFTHKYPEELQEMYIDNYPGKSNFIKNQVKINSMFSFASFSCVKQNYSKKGPEIFKIQGQVYHKMNIAAQPDKDEKATNGQIFFYDPDSAVSLRVSDYPDIDRKNIEIIENYLRENNSIAGSYMMMKDIAEAEEDRAKQNNDESRCIKMIFDVKGYDPKIYNAPTNQNEIAAIFIANADGTIPPAEIIVQTKTGKQLKNMSYANTRLEAFQYPLINPDANKGWSIHLKKNNKKQISIREYVSSRMAIRESEFNILHHCAKLFQQWCVNQYANIEWARLKFIRDNQDKLNVGKYKSLHEFLNTASEQLKGEVGRQIVLPSTFYGSPRNMAINFQDSMAICAKIGKPDIFLTMTCNPKHQDIVNQLRSYERVENRPDIVARVFNQHKKALIDDIWKKNFFGECVAYIKVIEYQKRGLPHMHMLITLKKEYKWKTSEIIDKFVRAEIPDPDEEPILYKLVTSMMIHGPCGKGYENSPCMRDGKCRFNYPWPFTKKTSINEAGKVFYKRSNNNRYVDVKGTKLDNRSVAPYCPALLLKYNCHINIDKVATFSSIKYLYKYLFKGYDKANVKMYEVDNEGKVLDYDEIKQHIDGRYLSPIESCWRIFGYDLQKKSHSVVKLPVHLEGEQVLKFDEGEDIDETKKNIEHTLSKETMLTAYLEYNKQNPDKQIKYNEIPEHCIYECDKVTKKFIWRERKKADKVIGRMLSVSPADVETFHLRLLLLHAYPKSFDDLKTYNGTKYATYVQACLARGIIKDDNELKQTLAEASLYKFPKKLRELFVVILLNCTVVYPDKLFDEFKRDLCEDMTPQRKKFDDLNDIEKERAYLLGFYEIYTMLTIQGKTVEKFPSLKILLEKYDISKVNKTFEEIDADYHKYLAEKMEENIKENAEQFEIYVIIKQCLENGKGTCIFIDGPAGTGKTYIYRAIYHLSMSMNKRVINSAFSGIAATLLPNGRTLHNVFGLPVPLLSDSNSNIEMNTKKADELKETKVFICDEATMAQKYIFEIIDRKLQEIMKNKEPFGGKIILLGGDFRQTLPIQERSTRSEIIDLSIKRSKLWKLFKVYKLTKNMRAKNDDKFCEDLLDIGNGTTIDEDENIVLKNAVIIHDELEKAIFEEHIKNKDFQAISKRAILAPTNIMVDEINDIVLDMLEGDCKTYTSIDEPDESNPEVTVEVLNAFEVSGFPKHCLKLKIGAVIICLRNLNVWISLCNGTRMLILDMKDHVLKCLIINENEKPEEVFIPRITLNEEKESLYKFKRQQFPVRLAFAMTINKAQGQTFDEIGLNLENEVFAHGQLYTACSRVRSWDKLKVMLPEDKEIERKTTNIVYKEILE